MLVLEITVGLCILSRARENTEVLFEGIISVWCLQYVLEISSVQFSSVAQSCPTLCDPMNCSTQGPPCPSPTPRLTQAHVHWVGDAIQPSHSQLFPSPPAPNPSQHQSLFQWVCYSHEVAKVLDTYITTGKTIALARQTFVGKVISLLFNVLSRLVITFIPRGKHLLISWLQSPSAVILEPPRQK